jgi:hypothetical protein
MQIEPRNKSTSSSAKSAADVSRPVPAQVVNIDLEANCLTLQVGDKQLIIPLQEGFTLGERLLYQSLSNGTHRLQKSPEILSIQSREQFVSSEWAKLLEFAERTLSQGSLQEKELWKIIQAVIPQLANAKTKRTEIEVALSPILEKAAAIQSQPSQAIATKVLETLDLVTPQQATESALAIKIKTLLGSLASNDFQAANPIIKDVANAAPALLRDHAPLRILQPMQELDDWGIPSVLSPSDIHKSRVLLEESFAIPLPKTMASVIAPMNQQTVPVKIVAVDETQMELEFPDAANTRIKIPLPDQIQSPWSTLLKPDTTITAKIANHSILPFPDAAYIPAKELEGYIAERVPFTANLVDAREFVAQYTADAPNPKIVSAFVKVLHELDLSAPHGQSLSVEQKELALRWLLTPSKIAPEIKSLLHYQSDGNREGELFQALPDQQQEFIRQAIQKLGKKMVRPQDLLEVVTQFIAQSSSETKDEVSAQLKQQLLWTQKDQETRHPEDRQQVFYFFQEGMLQKGQIQIRREGGQSSKQGDKDAPIRFHVETRTPRLGDVRVDFLVKKDEVRLEFLDDTGKAGSAVQAERALLADALQELGLRLMDLHYQTKGATATSIPQTQAPRTSFLDIKA